jgi:hypothetical protein
MHKKFAYLFVLLSMVLSTLACGGNETLNEYNQSNYGSNHTSNDSSNLSVQNGNIDYNSPDGNTWLVLLYQDADDEILEQDIFMDLNEAEIVGSDDQVTIISQLDRYDGAYDGDGDWTSTKRYYVTQDDDLETITSEELDDLGEVDMGDYHTLVDFATWAIAEYPADKVALVLSDHGAGWLGGWNDDDPNEGSGFTLKNIDQAMSEIVNQTGIGMFEFVGFDACLMGQLEVFSTIAPYARYSAASEETEPALGWAYAEFLSILANDPSMNGGELAKAVVSSYVEQDYRITDDDARQVFVEENFDDGYDLSADEVAQEMSVDITLTAMDLSKMSTLNQAVNQLAMDMQSAQQKPIARSRTYAQSYETVFDEDEQPPYIDLGNFAELLIEESEDANVQASAQQVIDAMNAAVIAEKHGDERPGSTGMSIYFPNSDLFETTGTDYEIAYTDYANRFAAASLWDDFLTFHYTGTDFSETDADLAMLGEPQASMAVLDEAASSSELSSGAEIESPVSGGIGVGEISLSEAEIDLDGVVTVSSEISGENIGYIYYYVAWYDEDSDSYLTADMGYIASDDIKQIGGVTYPDWGDDSLFELAFDWDPTLYYMSNGYEEEDQFAFFQPEVFGATEEDDVYSVYGLYTFEESGDSYDAVIKFDGNGDMKAIYGFTDMGSLSQITPSEGDTFTITEEWLEYDNNEYGDIVEYEGGTLEYVGENFTMQAYYGYTGEYVLGIVVEDLDGNLVSSYASIYVTE